MYKASGKRWAQKASDRMEKKGTKGSLTRIAKSHGYSSPLAFARHVEANPGGYSSKVEKKSRFAANINKGK